MRGVGIATRELDRLGGRSDQAKLNVKGLQGALGSLATAALNLPGPLGRVGQILGSFALGGGMMLAVTAGVAAVGAAWQALSRDAEEARRSSKAMADQLMSDSRRLSDFSRQALLVRQQTLEARRDELAQAIANQGKPTSAHPDLGTAAGRMAFGAATSAQRATFFFPTVSPQEAEKLYEYDRALREVTKAIQALDEAAKPKGSAGGSRAGGRVVELGPGPIDVETVRAYAKALADAAEQKRRLMSGVVGPIPGFQMDPNLPLTTIKRIADKAERDKLNQQLAQGAGIGALGGVASQMGPFGGSFSAGIGALAAGAGPMGIAAAASQGLISGLIGMADASQRAAEKARALSLAFKAWVDAAEFELGRISAAENAARNTARDANAQRGAALGLGPLSAAEAEKTLEALRKWMSDAEAGEARRRLDEINKLEKELTDHRRKEADEMERLATAYRNAPRGFFVEAYLGGIPRGPGGHDTVTGPVGTMPTGGGTRVTPQIIVSEGAIVVNGVNDPVQAAQLVVQGLTLIGSASGSGAGSRSRTLDLM